MNPTANNALISSSNTLNYNYVALGRDGENFFSVIRGNPRIIACNLSVELPLSCSPCPVSDTATQAKPDQNPRDYLNKHQENRAILYRSMDLAGEVLEYVQPSKGHKFQNRVRLCGKYIRSTERGGKGFVTLSVDKDTHHSCVEGNIHCDGIWLCAPCATVKLSKKAKQITTVQRRFLESGADKHWSTWFLTLTIPHIKKDRLDDLIDKKAAVMSELHAHSQFKAFKKRVGMKGYVDSLENRHSYANGWHPHHHILTFCKNMHPNTRLQCIYDPIRDYYRIATQADKANIANEQDKLNKSIVDTKASIAKAKSGGKREANAIAKLAKLENTEVAKLEKIEAQLFIYKLFAYLCVKNGLRRPSQKHGVDFRKSEDINDYLTKQSNIAYELTNDIVKTNKNDYSRSNWEILRDCGSDDPILAENSKTLFHEFALATHGKAKIHWSPRFLSEWLGENNKDDERELGLGEDEDEKQPNLREYYIAPDVWYEYLGGKNTRRALLKLRKMAEDDSLHGTDKAAIYLRKIESDIEQKRLDEEEKFRLEEERRFNEWLFKTPVVPDSYYEDEAQKVYDYDDNDYYDYG